ncbi:uncharacterized protein LOC134666829 [Cydia fagiglandana]|uniref:uncharacterized protein LOC134666829 n=1 Tax=Cydia fagiglandana TaxID=1458189 RepID=UPI002FEE3C87
MLCPEGDLAIQNEVDTKQAGETCPIKTKKVSPEDSSGTIEFSSSSFKNPKTWKKSFANFFRHQIRTSRSHSSEGDGPTVNKEKYECKEISPELKWQSLGKVFRRQSLIEPFNKASNQHGGESSTPNKRLAVRKVLSSYFGKSQSPNSGSDDK